MSECARMRNKPNISDMILRNTCELEWEVFFKGERASINALKQAYNYVARKRLLRQIVNLFRNKNLTVDNFMKYGSAKAEYRNTDEVKEKFRNLEKIYATIDLNSDLLKMKSSAKILNNKERLSELNKIDANAREFYNRIKVIDNDFAEYLRKGIESGKIKKLEHFPVYILGEDISDFLDQVNNQFKKLNIDTDFIPFDFNMGEDIRAKELRAERGFGGQQIRFDKFKQEWNKRTAEEKQEITEEFLRDELKTNTLKQALMNTNFPLYDRQPSIIFDKNGKITPKIIDIILNSNTFEKNQMYMMGGKKKGSKGGSKKGSKGGAKKASKKGSKGGAKKASKKGSKGKAKKY